jgi:hypothetical protein
MYSTLRLLQAIQTHLCTQMMNDRAYDVSKDPSEQVEVMLRLARAEIEQHTCENVARKEFECVLSLVELSEYK